MEGDLVVEGVLTCDPAEAFAFFTEPARLTRWWPSEAETDVRVGGSYRFAWPGPNWVLTGEYTQVVPGELLEFGWSWDHDDIDTTVRIEFGPADVGTELRIVHGCSSRDEREGYVEGWLHFLGQLEAVL